MSTKHILIALALSIPTLCATEQPAQQPAQQPAVAQQNAQPAAPVLVPQG